MSVEKLAGGTEENAGVPAGAVEEAELVSDDA
jgi:hypothetical protein